MDTLRIHINPEEPEKGNLQEAVEIIQKGGLVAFPTETVYGLGGDAKNPEASKAIYTAKGRPSDNPLIVHIHDFRELEEITSEVPEAARKLSDAFWPGPLTMILPKNDVIPVETTGGLNTVAIRMPSHPVARRFLMESNVMVAAPSANTSGRPSPTTADHVWEDLNGKIDCIIDGGQVEIGLESTIIDLSEEIPTVLRPGYINLDMLRQVIGQVQMDPGILAADSKTPPKAPGMRYKHYAPKAELTIIDGPENLVVEEINRLVTENTEAGLRVGIIATDENQKKYQCDTVLSIGGREDEEAIAHNLYGILREFDELGVDRIYSECFDTPRMGQAIMNRLLKAAGHHIITLGE